MTDKKLSQSCIGYSRKQRRLEKKKKKRMEKVLDLEQSEVVGERWDIFVSKEWVIDEMLIYVGRWSTTR